MKRFTTHARQSRLGAAIFTLLLASQLAACGGSSSGSSTQTPAPTGSNPPVNDPPVNNPPTTPPPPQTVSLRLQGVVTDEPIANAEVSATVGSQTFTTTAAADGSYSLNVEVEEASAGGFVTLTARGTGAQAFVEFKSLVGSLQSLIDQAGTDGILSNDENFSTQITNVSTAEAVLLQQANGGAAITSDAALQSLAASVNAQDVLDLAAAIKLAVDEPESYPLAAGQTILSIAADPAARQAFVNEVYTQDPAAFAAMQAAIVQDSGLAKPLTAADLTDFTAALLSTEEGFTFNYTNRVSMFTFNQDGTGYATGGTYDQPMTWTISGNTVAVVYDEPIATISFDTVNCNGSVRQVRTRYESEGATLAFISERTVAISKTSDVIYEGCPSLPSGVDTSTVARTVLTENDLQQVDLEALRGSTHTIYVYDAALQGVAADIATLNADGTGITRLTNQTFTWELEDGKFITAQFADGSSGEYMVLREVDGFTSDLFWEVRRPNGRVYTDISASVYLDPEYAVDLTPESAVGRFYQFGIGDETTADERLKGFRFRFDADGSGAQEIDRIENGALVTTDETVDPWAAFQWTIDGSDIVVRRTFDVTTNPVTPDCTFGTAQCVLWDLRRIIPLAADGNRVYVLEQRAMDDYYGVTNATPRTALVRFYDQEAASSGQNKPMTPRVGSKPRELLHGAKNY